MIDGCFVPNGNIKVDSGGDNFNFGPTSGGSFYDIRAGGTFAWPIGGENFTCDFSGIGYSALLGHGLILLYPNRTRPDTTVLPPAGADAR